MIVATSAGPHLFWITSRAAGTAALLLSSAAVCVGLLMGGRFVKRRGYDPNDSLAFFDLAMAGDAFDEAERMLDQHYRPIAKPPAIVPSPTPDSRSSSSTWAGRSRGSSSASFSPPPSA